MTEYLNNAPEEFRRACTLAGVQTTTRQFRKWKQGNGIARAFVAAVPFEVPYKLAKSDHEAAQRKLTEATMALADAEKARQAASDALTAFEVEQGQKGAQRVHESEILGEPVEQSEEEKDADAEQWRTLNVAMGEALDKCQGLKVAKAEVETVEVVAEVVFNGAKNDFENAGGFRKFM